MDIASDDRCRWLATHILVHESELRAWLGRAFGRTETDIDDVVQETYAILVSRARVDYIVNPRTYMFQVAKSVALKSLRQARVVSIGSSAELARVAETVHAMPAQAQRVFWMRRVEGLSQREIARSLCLSESTVEKHMMRALRLLRIRFGHGGNGGADVSSGAADGRWSDGEGEPSSRMLREH